MTNPTTNPTTTDTRIESALAAAAHWLAQGRDDLAADLGYRAGVLAAFAGETLDDVHMMHEACQDDAVWSGVVDGFYAK